MRSSVLLVASSIFLITACERGATGKATDSAAATAVTPSADAIDSALPREVELERFRKDLGPQVTELSNGFKTRDALVNAYLKHLAARDTAQLTQLALTRAEFGWIYYPSSPMGKPPYDLSPGLMYFQFDGNSRKGLFHALEERGGQDLVVVGYQCAMKDQQGENTVFAQCLVQRLQAQGDTLSELLFGGIIERHGRFKIINFANKF